MYQLIELWKFFEIYLSEFCWYELLFNDIWYFELISLRMAQNKDQALYLRNYHRV